MFQLFEKRSDPGAFYVKNIDVVIASVALLNQINVSGYKPQTGLVIHYQSTDYVIKDHQKN